MTLDVIANPITGLDDLITLSNGITTYVPFGITITATAGDAIVTSTPGDFDLRLNGTVFASTFAVKLGENSAAGSAKATLGAKAIVGGGFIGLTTESETTTIVNNGSVYGAIFGIVGETSRTAASSTLRLTNSGEITGGQDAYSRNSLIEVGTVFLTNTASGVMEGGLRSFDGVGATGRNVIVNNGLMIGGIVMGEGKDSYDGRKGSLRGEVVFGGGNDTARGGAGAEDFRGEIGNDLLSGGGGADSLTGGMGLDTLTGGAGNDAFIFARPVEAPDTITDFSSNASGNNDVIRISATGFGSGLSAGVLVATKLRIHTTNAAGDTNDRFIFRTTDKTLWFDADGNAGGDAVLIADLQAGASISAADIVIF